MIETDLQPILNSQISVLLDTAKLLDKTYNKHIPILIKTTLIDLIGYSILPNTVFAGIRDGVPIDVMYVLDTLIPDTIEGFTVINNPLTGKDRSDSISIYNMLGNDVVNLAIINTQGIIMLYSKLLCVYLNGLSEDGPKFGDAGRQIEFGPDGATENMAWFNTYRYQFYVSMSTFCKAVSNVLYDYGVHKMARPNVRMISDFLKIDVMFYDVTGRPVYVEPKITS